MSTPSLIEKLRGLAGKKTVDATQPKSNRSRTTSKNEPNNEGDSHAILTLLPEIEFDPIPTPFNRSAYHTPLCSAPATPALVQRGLVIRDIQLENCNPTRSAPDDVITVRTAPNCAHPVESTQPRPLAVSNHVLRNGRYDSQLFHSVNEEQILMQGSVHFLMYCIFKFYRICPFLLLFANNLPIKSLQI